MNKTYYLVGIGGISVSGIAKYLVYYKNKVIGSDITKSQITKDLEKLGVKIYIGQKKENITNNIDHLIYSSAAASPQAPGKIELDAAKNLNIPISKRSQFIGKLMSDKFGIAVSGMHGKTTTTGMLGYLLKKANKKPTVMLGGNFKGFNYDNIEIGNGDYFVTEACEYDSSFLDMIYSAAIITNIEKEHLDYFTGGLPEICKTFEKFIAKIPSNGFLVAYVNNKNVKKVIKNAKCEVIPYSKKDLKKYHLNLKIPGDYNKLNAIAVIKTVQKLGISKEKSIKILEEFAGVERRFEYKGKKENTKIYDDYAHHPTEIKTMISAAKKFFKGKILIIFQPHQYSRTKLLFEELLESFDSADQTIICDVYEVAGREEKKDIGSRELVNGLKKKGIQVEYTPNYQDALEYLTRNYKKFDAAITVGAGLVNEVGEEFLKL